MAAVWGNSAGVVLASLAGGSARYALVAPFRVPSMWAAVAGLGVNSADVEVPAVIEVPAETLAGAAIPAMLVVLGLQLTLDIGNEGFSDLAQLAVIRLLVGPLVAVGATEAIGVEGLARDVLIVSGAMPVAVVTVVLATQYGARATLLSRGVIVTTLLSIVTLTVLINFVA